MYTKFYCASCKNIFEATGNKKEWKDPIYGPCMKYIASCPDCNTECNEYREPSQKKNSSYQPQSGCRGCCNNCELAN